MRIRAAAAMCVAAALAACADAPAPDPLAAHLAAIDLPVIPHAGALPVTDRVVLSLDAEGEPVVDGVPLSWKEALARTTTAADRAGRDTQRRTSRVRALVAVDRRTPWIRVTRLLRMCADLPVRTASVVYVVRAEDAGTPGSFAAFLPWDRCCGGAHAEFVRVRVTADPRGSADVLDVARAVAALKEKSGRDVVASLDLPEHARLQVALEVAEAAARGGAAGITFGGAALSEHGSPATDASTAWRFVIDPPASPGRTVPPPPGHVGNTLGGIPWEPPDLPEEEKPEEEPPDAPK